MTLQEYLTEFAKGADSLKNAGVVHNYAFFKEFVKKSNLEKAEWKAFQEMGEHIYAFANMRLAMKRALGRPNHPIKHYRNSFLYLVYGTDPIEQRISNFCYNPDYRLLGFGDSAISEIIGYIFADKFVLYNSRDKFALDLLKIDPGFQRGDRFPQQYIKFNKAIGHVVSEYEHIVGQRTSAPINLEVDQFFSYLYEEYHERGGHGGTPGGTGGPATPKSRYWLLSAGEGARLWDDFKRNNIIAIGWDALGDLRSYKDREEITRALQKQDESAGSRKNDSLACFDFLYTMKPGDYVIAKKGGRQVIGYGKIISDYIYEAPRDEYRNTRRVEWIPISTENLILPEDQRVATKTLTDISGYPDWIKFVLDRIKKPAGPGPAGEVVPYSVDTALEDLFMEMNDFLEILEILNLKKNIVLQGPPGVGKSFIARRIAYALIGAKDPQKVELIQFHQSYSYEDFIQGFRPKEEGGFYLKDGVFYQFCLKAQNDPESPFVFIIDEINRGNLSKIFGELMLLIESDKRGKDFEMPLTYSKDADHKFYIPENVHLIGTMNTADRSLAMVDYALRRRFNFVTLQPQFDNPKFEQLLLDNGVNEALAKKIIARMISLNMAIAADSDHLGDRYCVGHSFFCPPPDPSAILDDKWYRRVIKFEIRPLLREYWFDNDEKAKVALDELVK